MFSEREHWQTAGEKMQEEKQKMEYQKEQDDIKIKEYYVSMFVCTQTWCF